jgi:hypothetical protein
LTGRVNGINVLFNANTGRNKTTRRQHEVIRSE